ncbi:MAG: ABC transporter permease [Clostridia bacterium]|nr:ABC transporter permease [Clostridia bacterium]
MAKYILKRVLYSILILFLASILIYSLVRMLPNDFVDTKLLPMLEQGTVKDEDIQRMKELYGLADNSFGGIIKGYFGCRGGALTGDLGISFKYSKPVTEVIGESMWISFIIAVVAYILVYLISIPLGIQSAVHQYSAMDYSVTAFTMVGISLPGFFLATILIKVFAVDLGWFPQQGLDDGLTLGSNAFLTFINQVHHCILPMLTLVILSVGGTMRHTRTNTLEVLNADYIRTARAKGLSEKSVIYKHVFRNTMIPMVTMMAGVLPSLFGGAMILEQVFSLPGIGKKAYDALTVGDIPFIMGYEMFLAILTVIGTLLSDLAYVLVDPRIKLDR